MIGLNVKMTVSSKRNQRWAEVLLMLAAGAIARLRGDRMSICSICIYTVV